MSLKRIINFTPVAYWYCCRVCKVCIEDRDQFLAHKINKHSNQSLKCVSTICKFFRSVEIQDPISKSPVSDDDSCVESKATSQIEENSSRPSESGSNERAFTGGDSVGSQANRNGHDHGSRCECDDSECEMDENRLDDSLSSIPEQRMKQKSTVANVSRSKKLKTNDKSEASEPATIIEDPLLKKPYPCKDCSKTFSYLAYLYAHVTAVHRNRNVFGAKTSSSFKCEFCFKVFYVARNLRQHMWSHSKEKPFSCGMCDKTFTFKQQLHKHINGTHTKEKLYQCTRCNSGFTYRQSLNYHIKKRHQ